MFRFPQRILVFFPWLWACATSVPIQTASVVPEGTYRLGGELNFSPYCGLSTSPSDSCSIQVRSLPLPQVKANVRHGLNSRSDLGLSLQLAYNVAQGVAAGAYVDWKWEILTRALDADRRQILSVGPGVGFTSIQVDRSGQSQDVAQIDLGLPIFFGHQFKTLELVGSARVLERITFVDLNQDLRREPLYTTELGVGVGLFTRGTWQWGVQLLYQTPVNVLSSGLFTVAVGVSRQLGSIPQTE